MEKLTSAPATALSTGAGLTSSTLAWLDGANNIFVLLTPAAAFLVLVLQIYLLRLKIKSEKRK